MVQLRLFGFMTNTCNCVETGDVGVSMKPRGNTRFATLMICIAVCCNTAAQNVRSSKETLNISTDSATVLAVNCLVPEGARGTTKTATLSANPVTYKDAVLVESDSVEGILSWAVSVENVQLAWKDKFDTSFSAPITRGTKGFVVHINAITGSVLRIESPYVPPDASLSVYPWKDTVSLWLSRRNWSAQLADSVPPATLVDALNTLASRPPSDAAEIIAYPVYMKWLGDKSHVLASDLPSETVPFWYVVMRFLDSEVVSRNGKLELQVNGECTLFQKLDVTHPRASDLETLYGYGTLSPL